MKVIFIKDLKKQGKVNEIKEVSDGYATNYLIKNGYAVKYTKGSLDRLNNDLETNRIEEEKAISLAEQTKKEIEKRIDDIIEFSELEEFIDNPVRTYSSGMYMRLAFSVAINVDADIILIDEILAVGDQRFQEKCMNKMQELKKMGKTMVFVSHSKEAVEFLCDRAVWINNGEIQKDGKTKEVLAEYIKVCG